MWSWLWYLLVFLGTGSEGENPGDGGVGPPFDPPLAPRIRHY
jgi:hypothetical protein